MKARRVHDSGWGLSKTIKIDVSPGTIIKLSFAVGLVCGALLTSGLWLAVLRAAAGH